MRTTLTLDDRIAKALKAIAHRSGRPFKQVVNETLEAGLAAREAPPKARPYRLKPASLGGVMPGVDLTKALRLAAALEDEEIARKLELRK
ncbi:MAG: CopG family transcriptional regulator [Burkholderiales bacterium]|nr:CopG family transcriptional regulator [Burkholderiales bacterium]